MGDEYISREEVLNLIDTAFESGAFDGRYAYENLIDAVQNLIHPLETDLISRQAAIKALYTEIIKRRLLDDVNDGMLDEFDTESILRALPSVEPERKTGKWIAQHIIGSRNFDMTVCSECREEFSYDAETGITIDNYEYCPKCGAKMEV